MHILVTSLTTAITAATDVPQPATTGADTGPGPMTFVLVAAVLTLLTWAGLVGATMRFVSTLAEVVLGLGKSFITGIGKAIAIPVIIILVVYVAQLLHTFTTS